MLKYPKDTDHCAFCPEGCDILNNTQELSYLTQVVIRVFSDKDDPNKFRCEIYFTPGATNDPLTEGKSSSLAPYVLLNKNISYDELCTCLDAVLAGSERPDEDLVDSCDNSISGISQALNAEIGSMENTPKSVGLTRNRSGSEPVYISPLKTSAPLLTINKNYADNQWETNVSPSLQPGSSGRYSGGRTSLNGKHSVSLGSSPLMSGDREPSTRVSRKIATDRDLS